MLVESCKIYHDFHLFMLWFVLDQPDFVKAVKSVVKAGTLCEKLWFYSNFIACKHFDDIILAVFLLFFMFEKEA